MHAGNIDLPEINTWTRMLRDPFNGRQQTRTLLGQFERLQRALAKPRRQRRLAQAHLVQQPPKTRRVGAFPDHPQGAVEIVQPDSLRHALKT